MRIVTKIEDFRKKRKKVYIDQEFAFVLYKGELRIYKLEEGDEISDETIEDICSRILPKRAKLRCMNLLQKREYTRAELYRKLEEGAYPKTVIEEALAYVESYGYIDDYTYVKRYIECKIETRSKRKVQFDLMKKGITKECMEEVFEEMDESILKDSECTAIKKELRKRKYLYEAATYEERQKAISFLCNKGYNISFVKEVIEENYLT